MAKKIQSSMAGAKSDALPDSPQLRKPREADRAPSGYTVGGVPVEDMPMGHMIPFANTDQGIEERLARPHAVTSMGRSERPRPVHEGGSFEKTLDARVAAGMDLESWDAPDPLKEAVDAHCPPGFRAKFLSDSVVKNRGTRGFKYHLVDGEPVKVAGLKMAIMPEDRAIARNKHFQAKGRQNIKQTQEQHDEELRRYRKDQGTSNQVGRRGDIDPGGGLEESETRAPKTVLR